MTQFSANLGFLFTELSLPDAIRAAARVGFDAVECHWPYDVFAQDVRAALDETGLPMLGLNTVRGNAGENGLSALVGRENEARAAIDQAVDYAAAIGALNIHVMAGFSSGVDAHDCFVTNLEYACEKSAQHGITILIEPLNHHDAPDYFLQTSAQAQEIIEAVSADNIKLMFDCYHLQIMEGDLTRRLQKLMPIIGHIQFASVPERSEPDQGEVNYTHIFQTLSALGYTAPLGAEYKPKTTTIDGLKWMETL
ncbi:TIM barrel protein [Amylibacter sp. SFDW26]|uniref:hydroxypyruvate isomerase family protein n=1 Tax=Amylibacter sp. SFDW26 TaxID=2652722 RepID=UPI001261F2E7|nr:TIM barrel protein [Amylibacter sp. SFDW26]KAB7615446.1 TIM barrel protein [Amylibacter sp. SFDW26]